MFVTVCFKIFFVDFFQSFRLTESYENSAVRSMVRIKIK
jgi:hypothetical protein